MKILRLVFAAGILTVGALHAAPILQYQVSGVGSTSGGKPIYRFLYTLSGFSFLTDQELEIRFDPSLYGTLSNASGPAGFDYAVFQPNNPPGTSGIYSAYSMVNNPALTTPFRVDAVYLGAGTPPSQPFFLNQYNANGDFRVVGSGVTVPVGGQQQVPEPATLTSVGVMLGLIGYAVRSRRSVRCRPMPPPNC